MIIADSSARPRAPPDGEAEAGAETPAPERVGRTSAGDAPGAPAAGLPRSPALASGEVPAPAEAAEPACGSCPGAPADAEPGTGGISGHADEPDAGRGAAAEAEEEEEAKVEKEQETEVQEEEEEKEKEGEEAAGRKPSVCGTSAPQSRGNAAAGPPAAPGDTETPESGEEFESQFAFRGSEAPSYIKRRADDLLATPTEKAKRFRGYSSDTEYKRIVPSHMQDGVKRLNRELLEFVNDPPANITAAPTEDNLYEWQGIIRGPPRTPYEGGTWFIRFQIPETYPYAPPKVRFMNKIYHCNIDEDGAVCLNILKDDWTAAQSIHSILLSITALLACPNPADPLRQDAAQLLAVDPVAHDKVAREYTLKHATGLDGTKNAAASLSEPSPELCVTPDAGAGPSADSTSANPPASSADEQGEAEEEDSRVPFVPSLPNGGPKLTKAEMIEQAKAAAREAAPPEMLELQGGKTLMEILLDAAKEKQ